MSEEKKTADMLKYMREYRKNNSEKYHKQTKCDECGGSYTYANAWQHKTSKKHQDALLFNKYKSMAEELCRLKGISE